MGYGSVEILGQDEILQKMLDLVVTRTNLTDLLPASQVTQILAAASRSDEGIYFQLAKLVDLFNLQNAAGSDLDLRLKDFDIDRDLAKYAVLVGNFSRTGTSGLGDIPAGTEVQTPGGEVFRTLIPSSIIDTADTSAAVSLIAAEPGVEGNVAIGSVTIVKTSFSGPELVGLTFLNSTPGTGGLAEESDEQARQRAVDKKLGLNRTSPPSMDAIARQVVIEATGESVATTNLVESLVTPGLVNLWIDNGTGLTETNDEVEVGSEEVLIASAIGGEKRFNLINYPVKRDGGDVPLLILNLNAAPLTLGVDYYLKSGTGAISLDETLYPTGLTATDALDASYTYYTGLMAEVQWTLNGVGSDPETYRGGLAGGGNLIVRAPSRFLPAIEMTVVVLPGFDIAAVKSAYKNAVIDTINILGIGEDVILVTLTDLKSEVEGVFDVFSNSPVPQDPPLNIAVGDDQIARAIDSSVIIN